MASRIGKSFASRGFFPRDLPPVFSSNEFGLNYAALVRAVPIALLSRWTAHEAYSAPRSKSGRRVFALVNPIPFLGLSSVIASNWKDINKIYRKSRISFSRPAFNSKTRAIGDSDFRGFRDCQITRSAGFSFVLHADFSRFFPTIYTHSIEWAAHTKAAAKAALRSRSAALWGKKLDEYVRCMQDGQTQGLPIGPDTSYVIAELIASSIDSSIQTMIKHPLSGGRLIDDYILFFETRADAEKALMALARACREFQVELNPEKTFISELKDELRESWVYKLAEHEPASGIDEQRRSILRFTDHAISLYAQSKSPSIGRYAIKVISGEVIHPRNVNHVFSCVMRLSRISPSSISDVVKLFSSYHQIGFKYDRRAVSRYIEAGLRSSLELGHSAESAWLLWGALQTKIKLSMDVGKAVSRSDSSPVLLLGKLLEKLRLIPSPVTQKVFGARLLAQDFVSTNWLLAYEGAMQSWFGWKPSDVAGSALEELAKRNVRFLAPDSVSPIVKRKENAEVSKLDEEDFDFDDIDFDELDEFYETDVADDGYDLVERDEEDEEEEEDEEDEGQGDEEGDDDWAQLLRGI